MKDDDPKWLELCAQHQAWARARTAFIELGMTEEIKWKRCVKSGSMDLMDEDCWADVIEAFPAP